jgi:cation/acetate symporter
VQVDVLGRADATFPLKNPALVTVPLSFATGVLVSRLAPEAVAAERFAALERRIHLGDA